MQKDMETFCIVSYIKQIATVRLMSQCKHIFGDICYISLNQAQTHLNHLKVLDKL